MTMINFFSDILKKNGKYSLRRVVIVLFVLMVMISWIAQQFFFIRIPEYMFHLLVDLLKSIINESPNQP